MSVNRIVRLSYLLPALALLSGCGGGSAVPSQVTNAVTVSSAPVRPDANHYGEDFMISSQPFGNDLTVYKRSGYNIMKDITVTYGISDPRGMVTTTNGWWYVTNGGHSNVLVYRIKKKKIPLYPSSTEDDYGQIPNNVAATPDRNIIAVSNYSTTTGGAGSVSVYLNRQSEPSRNLTYGTDTLQGQGIAIDHQGNCFWSFNDPNTNSGSVVEFPGCDEPGSLVVSGITNAGGIVFDQSGDLYYVDQASGIYQCFKTSNCKLWASNAMYGFGQPTNINFDYKEKALWLADAAGYLWGIQLKGHKCTDNLTGKGGTLCVHKYSSVDGDPYGIAPEPGD